MKHEHMLDTAGAEKAPVLGRGASFEDTVPCETVWRWMDDYGAEAALTTVRLLRSLARRRGGGEGPGKR